MEAHRLTYSPVLGPKGNIEFFVWWKRNPQGETTSSVDAETVSQVVAQAHEALM